MIKGLTIIELTLLRWIGTGAQVIGAFAVANALMSIGYPAFLIGSTCWMIVAYAIKDKPLLILNVVFWLANVNGIYSYLLI